MAKAARSPASSKPGAKAKPVKLSASKPSASKALPSKVFAGKPFASKSSVGKPYPSKSLAGRSSAVEAAAARPAAAKATKRASPKIGGKVADASADTVLAAKTPRAARTTTARMMSAAKPSASKASTKTTASRSARPTGPLSNAPINLGYLSDFVGFHLRLAQDASYRAFARIKEKDLVKPGRFPALAIIHLNPGISQSALGRAIARDKSTVSPLIKDLQKNGLISRKPSPSDRRSVTLLLTKKGERVLQRLHARALEHETDLDKLVGASKARLVGLLDKITGGLGAATA